MTRQWNEEELLRLARAYQPACALGAAADLELFDALAGDQVDAGEAARRIRGDPRGTTILLDALTALELLEKRDGRYSVPVALRRLLTPGGPGSVLAMIQHQVNCLRRWSRLAEVVRDGRPPERTPGVRGEHADLEAFIEAMEVVNRADADRIVAELMPLSFRRLLDVGGASGTWTIAWLRANPDAGAILFDLPEVVPLAEERLEAALLLDRVTVVPGDFETGKLPTGADLAWLSAIVHQNSREQNRRLFASVHAALLPGGRILVRDYVMEETRTRPAGGALFAVNMLTATPGGGTFTFAELREDLEAAGFGEVAQLREDESMHAVVGGRKLGR